MRRYQSIWIQLRQHKQAKVVAPVRLHGRIIKAVQKEKWMDSGFKLLSSEEEKEYKLSHSVENETTISFLLEEVHGIKLSDL